MQEKNMQGKEEMEIDLQRLLGALLDKSLLIGLVAVICALLVFVGTFFLVAPKYQSSVMFYVNNSSLSIGDASVNISSGDISASRGLVKSYIIILKTRETLTEVIDYAGVDRTYGQVKGMIAAEAVDSTEIFQVVVTSTDPQEAEKIATAIAKVLPDRIDTIVDGTSSKVVEAAVVASSPSSPNYTKNAMIGFAVGLLAMIAIIVIKELTDTTIRTEEDINGATNHPLLVTVPDMAAKSKGGYYGYRRSSHYDNTKETDQLQPAMVGSGISFAAAEAYKVLRTKLQFSFADERTNRIIGVSSAVASEGKSLTAVNLAHSMSQLGKKVLLIDCDMRCPTVHQKLPVKKAPGLSDYLSGQVAANLIIQPCGMESDGNAFHVISAGRIPPNPVELLSSKKMEKTLEALRESYDYIILDLPPVGEVGDALAVAKQTDGMLLLVRQGVCSRPALNAAARQFEFIDAKILGIVYNCVPEDNAGYKKNYYKKYGKGYYRRYKYAASQAKSELKDTAKEG
jgi:capsular exopolysaccharide synthesis family protein